MNLTSDSGRVASAAIACQHDAPCDEQGAGCARADIPIYTELCTSSLATPTISPRYLQCSRKCPLTVIKQALIAMDLGPCALPSENYRCNLLHRGIMMLQGRMQEIYGPENFSTSLECQSMLAIEEIGEICTGEGSLLRRRRGNFGRDASSNHHSLTLPASAPHH